MEALYTAEALATGSGRNGHVTTHEGRLDLDLAIPKEMGGSGNGANPEQLFAAGFSACFHSALQSVARAQKVSIADSSVGARVQIGANGQGGYGLAVQLEVLLPGLPTSKHRPLRMLPTRCARTRTRRAATSTSPSRSRTTDARPHPPHLRSRRRRTGRRGVPSPEPGPGQVRLRILLSPIHNHDIWTIRGTYGFKPELPAASGTEAVGVVDALGDGVENLTIGQRVATGGTFGTWAEYVVTKAAGLIPVPDAVADESAAQLISMPFSAISLLEFLTVQEGDWIVQNAANGAVGRMLAQLGKARGVNVLGLVRRTAGVEELRAQGIENVIATDQDDWREQAEKITGSAPISAGVDSVGGAASGDVLSLLAENGTLVAFGAMNSP